MKSFAIALVLLSITFSDVSSKRINNRIVGGYPALDGQFKYQVSLRNAQNVHFCGGSIIKPFYVLTSAKCIYNKNPGDVYVVAGTNYLNVATYRFRAYQLTIHGSYNSLTYQNDIAVVRTMENLLSVPNTNVIGLAVAPPYPGQRCTLTGWGKEHISLPNFSNVLRVANLEVISLYECQRALSGNTIFNTNTCTRPVASGGCDGDTGGPLVDLNVQIGILSWGIPCAAGKPDVYTDVASYYNWISMNTIVK